MKTWLNYHHLYYFKSIADEGGIAKAAKKLRLGQPTLSTQLKQLEDSLGHLLFERKNRQLFLTESGKVALEYANEIFRLGEEMREALGDQVHRNKIHVQLGALDSIPKQHILHATEALLKSGSCSVSILEGKGDELLRELSAHRIDLLLSNFPAPIGEQSGFYSRSLSKLPVAICGSEKFRSLKRDFPRSIHNQPFVLPTTHSKLRHDFDHFLKIHSLHVDVIAETQDTTLQKLLGVNGAGLIPISKSAVQDQLDEKRLFIIGDLPHVQDELWLISASRKIENPIAAKFFKSFNL